MLINKAKLAGGVGRQCAKPMQSLMQGFSEIIASIDASLLIEKGP